MFKRLPHWMIWLIVFLLLAISAPNVPAAPNTSSSLSMLSPSNCPLGGCAAGQRINFRTSFDLNSYTPSVSSNVQICLYTPENWNVTEVGFDSIGKISGLTYQVNQTNCGPSPSGYELIAAVSAPINISIFGDTLDFYLRLGKNASANGTTLIRVYENNGLTWLQTEQSFNFLQLAPISNVVYVAESAQNCASNSPCFINSADDLPNGIGTGLKDAIDAVGNGATINVLGNYPIRGNTVKVNKPVILQGFQNAFLTTKSLNCSQPMLSLESNITLQNLSIDDGLCSLQNRDLLLINSIQSINIISNNLTNGKEAISIQNNQGSLNIRFNNILNNSGYAILKPINSGNGQLMVTANNIFNNRIGAQVQCSAQGLGIVDHNFWGIGILPGTAAPDCTAQASKRLGSAISNRTNQPGVLAELVTVTSNRKSFFENSIAVQRPTTNPDTSDFDIFIINHGNNLSNAPFLNPESSSTLVPCGNYYDIFLAQGFSNIQELDIFFRYDLNPACVANIESTTYCGQANAALYPLWWYDPNQQVTNGWNTTGQSPNGPSAGGVSGQTTTCDLVNKEISVQIDSSGRPGSNNDLSYTPFVVGLIAQPAATVLNNFSASAGNMQITINWKTLSELNTSGFYVQRRLSGESTFVRVSPFIVRTGSDTTGSNYSFVDGNVVNYNSYEYRLEIIGTNLLSVYSNIITAIPIPPTITPTTTLTSTITLTATVTQTPTITGSTTITATNTPTITLTPTITFTPTRTRAQTATNTRTPFIIPYRSPTRAPTIPTIPFSTGYPPPLNNTQAPESGYPNPPGGNPPGGVNSTEGSYPEPENTRLTPSIEGYPGPELDENQATVVMVSGTPIKNLTKISTSITKPSPSAEAESKDNKGDWVYPLLGSIIGLCLVILVGYFLWKKGLLALPFLSNQNDQNNNHTDDLE